MEENKCDRVRIVIARPGQARLFATRVRPLLLCPLFIMSILLTRLVILRGFFDATIILFPSGFLTVAFKFCPPSVIVAVRDCSLNLVGVMRCQSPRGLQDRTMRLLRRHLVQRRCGMQKFSDAMKMGTILDEVQRRCGVGVGMMYVGTYVYDDECHRREEKSWKLGRIPTALRRYITAPHLPLRG